MTFISSIIVISAYGALISSIIAYANLQNIEISREMLIDTLLMQ